MAKLMASLRPRLPSMRASTCAALAGACLVAILALAVESLNLLALALFLPLLGALIVSLRLYAKRTADERRQSRERADLYVSVVEALAGAIDAGDRATQTHLRRVQAWAVALGRCLRLSDPEIEALRLGALLRDVGKLAVPDHVLCKPGPLTHEETAKMRTHPRLGVEILETVRFPFPLSEAVRSHHEKWDGTGYPDRLKGEEIPLTARILSVVDCFDALTSDRPYRKPIGREEAVTYIRSEAGASFDPAVVEALVNNLDRLALPAEETTLPRGPILGTLRAAQNELYALYEIARSAAGSLNLDEAMGLIAAKIAPLIHYRGLVLYLYDKESRLLRARYVGGLHSHRLGHHTIHLGERMSGRAALHRMPIKSVAQWEPGSRVTGLSDLEELISDGTVERLESSIVVPLLEGEAVLGVLALYDGRDHPYEDDHLRVISIVAEHVAAAVRNALQYGAGQGSTLIDPLTRLPNARYLFVSFDEEIGRALRQHVPLSIVELDVNGFNEVNDRHGHAAGDRILRELARLIRTQLRGWDTCVRYAADEFIVIVPGVGKKGVNRLQRRIQEAIESHEFAVPGGKPVRLAVSMGVSSFPEDGQSFDALIAVADARMYELKSSRRKGDSDGSGYQRFTGRRSVGLN